MKPATPNYGQPKQGERTATSCPVCGDAVLKQEGPTRSGTPVSHRLVCSKRGCPWQAQVR